MGRYLLAAVAAVALGATAEAAPIAPGSVLNIVGNSHFDATSATFPYLTGLVLGSGDFALLGTCAGCVAMTTPLTYSPLTFGTVYTATNAGLTAAFTTNALISQSGFGTTTLDLVYSGIATLTGFDPTPGFWTATFNQFGNLLGSFSASTMPDSTLTIAVPEPTALAILGTSILGLGLRRRR
jgi:hypothetical protein